MEILYLVESHLSLMTVETCGPAHVSETLGIFTHVDDAVDCARRYATREYSADFIRQAVIDITVREIRLVTFGFDMYRKTQVWSAASEGLISRQK